LKGFLLLAEVSIVVAHQLPLQFIPSLSRFTGCSPQPSGYFRQFLRSEEQKRYEENDK